MTNGLLAVTALVFLLIQVFRFGQTTTAYTIFEFGGMYGQVVRYDPTQLWRLISPSLSTLVGSILSLTALLCLVWVIN